MPIGVISVAASTGGGNQSISGPPSMGTAVPKCVIIECTRGTALGTIVAGANISRGAWDGTNVRSVVAASEDNSSIAAVVNSAHRVSASAIIQILSANTAAVDGEADPVSMDAGGVTINWTNAPGTAVQLQVTFIWGDDWEAAVGGYIGDGTINNAVTVSGLAFRPRGLLLWSGIDGVGSFANAAFTAGVVALNEDGTVQGQNGWGWGEPDSPTAVTAQATSARDDCALIALTADATTGIPTLLCRHEVTSGTSDGFVVTTRSGSNVMIGLYVALRNANRSTWSSMPTLGINTTGAKTVTPGFPPGTVFGLPTMVIVSSKNTTIGTDHMGMGLGVACQDGTQKNIAVSAEDAAATSDTYSVSGNNFAGLDVAGSADWVAAVINRTSTTFDFNVTNAAAADVLTGFLVFEGTFDPGWWQRTRTWPRRLGRM